MNDNKESPDRQSGRKSKTHATNNYNDGNGNSPPPFFNLEETEKCVLYFIILEQNSSTIESLDVEDFESEANKLIFGAMKGIHARGEPIDFLTIYDELGDTPRPDGGDWGSYLTNVLPTALPVFGETIDFHIAS